MEYQILKATSHTETANLIKQQEVMGWRVRAVHIVPMKFSAGFFRHGLVTAYNFFVEFTRDPQPPVPTNLLVNPGFEEGTYLQWPDHDNIKVPVGWKLWYTHGERKCTNSEILERQPEAGLIDLSVDPVRVYEGSQALKVHTYCGCHNIRLYQTVPVEVGLNYRASIYMHHWYSDCSSEPHTEPLMRDCKTPFSSAWAELRLGVDPLGLDDPESESIAWTGPVQEYGFYGTEWRVHAVAESEKLTVVASSWTSYPLMHEDWYVDAAVLTEV